MIPYWLLFAVFAFPAALTKEQSRQRTLLGFLISAIVLTVMIGLRKHVGGDWNAYDEIFHRLRLLSMTTSLTTIDPAYAFVNWWTGNAGLGVWFVNLVCAAIFTYGFLIFCREQLNPALAILVGIPYLVIVVAMGYTRQGAALGLVMAALTYYFRGATVRMAMNLTLAIMFHKSAVIVIPLVALASSRRRALTFLLLGVVGGVTYYLFVSSSLDRLVANYVAAGYSSSGAAIRIAMNLVPATIFLLFWRRFQLSRDQLRLWTIFSVGSFVALGLLLTTPSSTAVDRISLYLIPLQIFVLSRVPRVFSKTANASVGLKFAIIMYSAAVQFTWLNYAENSSAWVPYNSYLTDWMS